MSTFFTSLDNIKIRRTPWLSLLGVSVLLGSLVAGCAGPSGATTPVITVQQQCEPVNKCDTRCDLENQTTQAAVAQPVTLTRPHKVTYELAANGGSVRMVTYTNGPGGYSEKSVGDMYGVTNLPWRAEVDVPAATKVLVRYYLQGATDVRCRALIDGEDVTGSFPQQVGGVRFERCGATYEL
ncbi:hypothetical protein ACL02T_09800 [Pseudonocardia sp. RS010]|uniref:hypothetical protein n=1 Tax=Pseudonocardia sp. RS010 TaxID=3385979 RepID=UPI00399F0D51